MESKIKVFITGSTGFIGSNLISKLIKDERIDKIYALNRKRTENLSSKVETLIGDLKSIELFKKEIGECDYVFHLAANAVYGSKADYQKDNYYPTVKLAKIIKKNNPKCILVYTSTIGACDRNWRDNCNSPLTTKSSFYPRSKYGKSKADSEKYITNSGLSYVIIRPTWVYGAGMREKSHINTFVTLVYKKSFLTKYNFPGKVSLISVNDLTDALMNCINNKICVGKTYFGVTESLSLGVIFEIISKKLRIKRKMVQLPFENIIRRIISSVHFILPLSISNLFIDYLLARDNEFRFDLLREKQTERFEDKIYEVIATNNIVSGLWVITGANSGIGLELAKLVRRMNKPVILIDKNDSNLKELFTQKEYLKIDLSNHNFINSVLEKIAGRKIHVLINNAGIGFKNNLIDMELDKLTNTLMVNCISPIILIQNLYSKMSDGSVIANIASSCAYSPLPGMSVYAASKSFVLNISESLREELNNKVKVITISPSGVETSFQKTAGVEYNKSQGLLTPIIVAHRICNLIESNKNGHFMIFSLKSRILWILTRLLPIEINAKLQGRLFKISR